jgi:adenylate cyclase
MVTGWVFLFVELEATDYQNLHPDSTVSVTWPVFIFATLAVITIGLLVGTIEMVWAEKRFRAYSLGKKVVFKSLLYISFIMLILLVTYPIAAAIDLNVPITDRVIWDKTRRFFFTHYLFVTLVQVSFSLLLSLLYAAISENLGHQVLIHFFTGKYHRPRVEQRIFMFLDMKDSTAIAERLGHDHYFELLSRYYEAMSDAIIDSLGEVYQYIGDEVVVSWRMEDGLKDANCLRCYFGLKQALAEQAGAFRTTYGVIPDFRAGMHVGEVTTGEIGALKKEIVFTGDVLNTTSRLQALTKDYQTDLLISSDLGSLLDSYGNYAFENLGTFYLRGKSEETALLTVNQNVRNLSG